MMETISKVKRQPLEWEKIITNEATDKELISKICKQLLQFNPRKISYPTKKCTKELNRQFSKEDIQTHEKRLSITYYQRNANKNHNEVCQFRMAAIRKSTNNKSWRGCRVKGTLLHCWWECKLVQPLWRTV